jgi:hypothetical protein
VSNDGSGVWAAGAKDLYLSFGVYGCRGTPGKRWLQHLIVDEGSDLFNGMAIISIPKDATNRIVTWDGSARYAWLSL